METKRIILAILLLSFIFISAKYERPKDYSNDKLVYVEFGRIDWTAGIITAYGDADLPLVVKNPKDTRYYDSTVVKAKNIEEARIMAEQQALLIAIRNLNNLVKRIKVSGSITIGDYIPRSEVFRKKLDDFVQKFKIVDKKIAKDKKARIMLSLQLYGKDGLLGLNDAENPQDSFMLFNRKEFQQRAAKIVRTNVPRTEIFTGLVLDCRNLKLDPVLSPKIFDEKKNIVYSSEFVYEDYALKNGIVLYTKAEINPRIGANSFYVIPESVKDGDFYFDKEICDLIFARKEVFESLKQCNVMVIMK